MKKCSFLDILMTSCLHFCIRRLFSTCFFHSLSLTHPVSESPTLFLSLPLWLWVILLCKNEWKRQFLLKTKLFTIFCTHTHKRHAHNQGVLFCQMDLKAVNVSVALFRCKLNKEKAIQIIFDMYVLMSNKNLVNKNREKTVTHCEKSEQNGSDCEQQIFNTYSPHDHSKSHCSFILSCTVKICWCGFNSTKLLAYYYFLLHFFNSIYVSRYVHKK